MDSKKVGFAAGWKSRRDGCLTGRFDREALRSLEEAGVTSLSQLTECKLLLFEEREKKSEKSPDLKIYVLIPQSESPDEVF